ncbi:hypothetical protein SK128_019340, partial [Halocaridina rubra]
MQEDEDDIWERVLQEPPLTQHRTWECVGQPPLNKEKPFLSELGPKAAHNVWIVYQELWSNLDRNAVIPPLCVIETSQLCKDILYLLIGIPSVSFPWCQKSEKFVLTNGLCTPSITPKHLQDSVAPLLDCATCVKRLDVVCSVSESHTSKFLDQGFVYHAFLNAVLSILEMHRYQVLLLSGERYLLQLLQRVKKLVRRIKFVSSVCHVTLEPKILKSGGTLTCENQSQSCTETAPSTGISNMPRGMNLIGELISHLLVTKNEEYLTLLVYLIKSTCIPFL